VRNLAPFAKAEGNEMLQTLSRMLAERGLAPHGYCLLWDPALIWTHVLSDLLIGLAYFSIPLVFVSFLARRRDVQFGWVGWLFAGFILACGATHFMSILVLWVPAYGIEGLIKVATAVLSVITAIALWPLLPTAIALPSPSLLAQANADLHMRIAERDAALAALKRETAEREHAQDLLRQAQKMDAIGQLTGGVAHDFNNLLMIISGSLERAQRMTMGNQKLADALGTAMEGTDRAAKLTQQLLAFARRQPHLSSSQDLTAIVEGIAALISSTLGAQYELVLRLAPDLPKVLVDRLHTENTVLNLALNARDAMPDGGRLVISTRASGTNVLLVVSDTGVGMTDAVRERIFEPFFTTKPVGQGTGLGLSQVYGFTKQSDGDVAVESAPGKGTTITLILPAIQSGPAA
jgi:signal transduction histidine kinase